MSGSETFWALMVFGVICFVCGLQMGKEMERQKHE